MIFQGGITAVLANPTGGNLATPSGPQRGFTIQTCELDFQSKIAEALGQNQSPDDIFASDRKYTGKCTVLQINPDIYNALMFGDTITQGQQQIVNVDFAAAVPGTGPYTITITPPTSGVFVQDLGVVYSTNPSGFSASAPFYNVGSGSLTAAGQYKVAGAVYTFDSADSAANVKISYSYSVTTGRSLTVFNHPQSYGPFCEIYLPLNYQGFNTLHIKRVRFTNMGFKLKRDGHLESPLDFSCFPDGSGAIFNFDVANLG